MIHTSMGKSGDTVVEIRSKRNGRTSGGSCVGNSCCLLPSMGNSVYTAVEMRSRWNGRILGSSCVGERPLSPSEYG